MFVIHLLYRIENLPLGEVGGLIIANWTFCEHRLGVLVVLFGHDYMKPVMG